MAQGNGPAAGDGIGRVKRLIDCTPSVLARMGAGELRAAIAASEGRVLVCETIGTLQPMLGDVTNAELAAAMGADILLLNLFDAQNPEVRGLPPVPKEETIRALKRLTGRVIGVNLEPAEAGEADSPWALTPGRRATPQNAWILHEMGADMLLLTGNPGIGVGNRAIEASLRAIRAALGENILLAAGKMHASGVLGEAGEHIVTAADVEAFVAAGADIVLLPAPGTVPGITVDYVRALVGRAHALGALALTAVGTSQEGADRDTIRQIALWCKMAGADLHHLGDAGYGGVALPENILAYSVAVRGVRHTYRRMAASCNR